VVIEARDITKAYGPHTVLDRASLAVGPGESVVLTGDNGSGKTTLLHVLVGLRRADAGVVVWKNQLLTSAGRGVWRRARAAWGFLPQQVSLPPAAPVGRLLRFHARLRGTGLDPARRWLARVGLEGTEQKRVDALSGGMQQRLGIALTLFFEPEMIVMDEPASSLDPGWRDELATWTTEQAQRGAAVLVTSQLHESWGAAVRFCHCADGRIVDEGTGVDSRP
jgi:ABC-type multidrug transport system ATPase subunit